MSAGGDSELGTPAPEGYGRDARSLHEDRPLLLVLQHIECEPPGAYEDELLSRGIPLTRVLLDAGEPLPDWREFAAIVAMGGPMGAYDDHTHPWLRPEKALIGEAVRSGLPYWGICLGAQLLAAALGARVYAGPRVEVGVLPVRLSEAASEDPVFARSPREFDALHWHGDTYELPRGAAHLARSALYAQQAFVFERAYGIQFHLETSVADIARWAQVPAYRSGLERAQGDLDALLARTSAAEERMRALARDLFAAWLERAELI